MIEYKHQPHFGLQDSNKQHQVVYVDECARGAFFHPLSTLYQDGSLMSSQGKKSSRQTMREKKDKKASSH